MLFSFRDPQSPGKTDEDEHREAFARPRPGRPENRRPRKLRHFTGQTRDEGKPTFAKTQRIARNRNSAYVHEAYKDVIYKFEFCVIYFLCFVFVSFRPGLEIGWGRMAYRREAPEYRRLDLTKILGGKIIYSTPTITYMCISVNACSVI